MASALTEAVPQGFEADHVPEGFEPDTLPQGFEPDTPSLHQSLISDLSSGQPERISRAGQNIASTAMATLAPQLKPFNDQVMAETLLAQQASESLPQSPGIKGPSEGPPPQSTADVPPGLSLEAWKAARFTQDYKRLTAGMDGTDKAITRQLFEQHERAGLPTPTEEEVKARVGLGEKSLIGISPENIDFGTGQVSGFATAGGKLASGIGEFVTSPSGIIQSVLAATPAGLAVKAKWLYDMAAGAGISAQNLHELYQKTDKTPEDYQAMREEVVNTIGMLVAAGLLAKPVGAELAKPIAERLVSPGGLGIPRPEISPEVKTLAPQAAQATSETIKQTESQPSTEPRATAAAGRALEPPGGLTPPPSVASPEMPETFPGEIRKSIGNSFGGYEGSQSLDLYESRHGDLAVNSETGAFPLINWIQSVRRGEGRSLLLGALKVFKMDGREGLSLSNAAESEAFGALKSLERRGLAKLTETFSEDRPDEGYPNDKYVQYAAEITPKGERFIQENATKAVPQSPKPPVTKTPVLGGAQPKPSELAVETPAPSPAEAKGVGAAVTSEFDQPGSYVSNMFAAIDTDRKAMGKEPMPDTQRRTWDSDNRKALEKMNREPDWIPSLLSEVSTSPRPLLSWENAGLVWQRAKWKAEWNNALARVAQAADDGRLEDVASAQADARRYEDALQFLDEAVGRNGTGSEAGRSLQAQKMGTGEDFSLIEMRLQNRAKANNGRPLNPEQEAEVTKAHERIADLEKQLAEKQATEAPKDRESATDSEVKDVTDTVKKRARQEKQEGIERDLEAEQKDVVDFLKDQFIETGSLDGTNRSIRKLMELLVEREGVTERLPMETRVHKILQTVDPHITRENAMDLMSNYGKSKLPNPEFAKKTVRDINSQILSVRKLLDYFKGQVPKLTGQLRDIPSAIQQDLIKMVNEAKKVFKLDVPTDNAKAIKSALDAINTRLKNRLRSLKQEVATRQKIIRERSPSPYNDETIRLRNEIEEVQKAHDEIFGKPELTEAQRLAIAEKSAERQIVELERQMRTGEIFPKGKEGSTLKSEKLDAAKSRIEELKLEREFAREAAQPRMESDAAQVESRVKFLDKQISDIEQQIKDEAVFPKSKTAADPATDARVMEREARLKSLKEERQFIRERIQPRPELAAKELEQRAKALGKKIEEVQRQIRTGEIFPKDKKITEPEKNDLIRAREAELKALEEQRQWSRDAAQPRIDPQEAFLLNYLLKLRARSSDYFDRAARGDFSKKARPVREYNPDILKAQADVESAKQEWRNRMNADELKNRTFKERLADWLVNWHRLAVISGLKTLGKLFVAGESRIGMTAADTAMGLGLRNIPGIRAVAEGAPREGLSGGKNIADTAKGYLQGWKYAAQEVGRVIKTGQTSAEAAHFAKNIYNIPFGRYLYNLHSLMKLPAFAQEYKISYLRRSRFAESHGVDMTDKMEQFKIDNQAVQDGLRAKLSQDNFITKRLQMLLSSLENSKEHQTTGKLLAKSIRFLLPVTHIPMNWAIEGITYSNLGLGLPRAAGKTFGPGISAGLRSAAEGPRTSMMKAMDAFSEAVDKMTPEQKDSIMRHWKKGAIGAGLMLLGFYQRNNIGGYYQPGKRDEKKPEFGGIQLFGHNIPRYLIHLPIFEPLHFGATIGHVMEHVTKKTKERGTFVEGVAAATAGLLDETPYVSNARNTVKVLDTNEGRRARQEMLKSTVVPKMIQEIAEWTDRSGGKPVERDPKTGWQRIKAGIPILRQTVPKKGGTGTLIPK